LHYRSNNSLKNIPSRNLNITKRLNNPKLKKKWQKTSKHFAQLWMELVRGGAERCLMVYGVAEICTPFATDSLSGGEGVVLGKV